MNLYRPHIIYLAVLLTLLHLPVAHAQSSVILSETKLSFRGILGVPIQRTVTLQVTGQPIHNFQVIRHDLVDTLTGAAILADQISADPSTSDQISGSQIVRITVPKFDRPGHYRGTLDILYDGLPIDEPLIIALDVALNPAPAVDVDLNAKNLAFGVQQGWSLPYIGRPAPNWAPPSLAEQTIYLIQNADGDALVQQASVLTMRDSSGQTLPNGVARVTATLPFTLTAQSSAPITVTVDGTDLQAGEYSGALLISVRDQAPLQIPLILRIKHGPLLPLIVLVSGIITALLFSWWNSSGKPTQDLLRPIQQLAIEINHRDRLQAEDRDGAFKHLRQAVDAINAGDSPVVAKTNLEGALQVVADAQARADTFLNDSLAPAAAEAQSLTPHIKLTAQLVSDIERIDARVRQGQYQRLADAARRLDEVRPSIQLFKDILSYFAQVPEDKREDVLRQMNDATTPTALRKALESAGVKVPPRPGEAFGLRTPDGSGKAAFDGLTIGWKRRLQLSIGHLLVALIAYLFTLIVGWISIYVRSPTFGADPGAYITLFLWGAVVEAVRGQTVTISSLKTFITEQKPAVVP